MPTSMTNHPMLMTMIQAEPSSSTQFLLGLAPWLMIFVIFWFLMIRPQQRKMRDHQAALNAIKKGDDIVTGGGIRGRVTKVSDDEVEVEIANNVRVRVIKSTITGVLAGDTPARAND